MRQRIVAANWKMNLDFMSAKFLVNDIENMLDTTNLKDTILIIAAPFPYIDIVSSLFVSSGKVFAAAQNCHWEEGGAYTGEVSAGIIKSVGARYVIVGHSERRHLFHETNETIAKKITAIIKNDLRPIICCGEKLSEREESVHFKVIEEQLVSGLFHLTASEIGNTVIAYEPVWAIGTGKTASPEQAQEVHAFIRRIIKDEYGSEVAANISILYGGSCSPTNSKELFAQPDIDGGLVGGASLKAESFLQIAASFPA